MSISVEKLESIAELARAALSVLTGWQPISTVPKDGTYLVTNARGEVCPCQSRNGSVTISNQPGYCDWTYGEHETHWMPLPPPPASPKGDGE